MPCLVADILWRRRARPLLGTRVEVAVLGDDEAAFVRACDSAFAVVARFHAAMSFHEATSDLRAIAGAAPGRSLVIDGSTWAVLDLALELERASAGVFKIAIGDELGRRGVLPILDLAAGPRLRVAAIDALHLDGDSRLTVLSPVSIDLGGIAKGAAIDAAIAALRSAGTSVATVNAGGDIAVLGNIPQPITVRGPGGMLVEAGELSDGAIATSGPFAADAADSLVAPDAVRPRWADRTVSVVAPRCAIADALTKVVAILGHDAAELLDRYDARAFSIDADGRIEPVATP